MAGVILENLNAYKLGMFAICLAFMQLACFLLGGFIAPSPNTSENILATICIDDGLIDYHSSNSPWFFIWPETSNYSCKTIYKGVQEVRDAPGLQIRNASNLVFMLQFPLRRDGLELDMSRWFQEIITVLHFDLTFHKKMPIPKYAEILMDVRLGYRSRFDHPHQWKELARSREKRFLNCKIDSTNPEMPHHVEGDSLWLKDSVLEDHDDYNYDCDLLPLFTLGNCHHDYYLLNIRLPAVKQNENIGSLDNIWMVEIHQNGGFTRIWFAMKTIMFIINFFALWFYRRRLKELPRYANVLEGSIFIVGVAMTMLNIPVEWLSLWIDTPFWLLLSDVRQGLYYACLMSFWVVFIREHALDDSRDIHRHIMGSWHGCLLPLRMYNGPLLIVLLASFFFLVFDVAERGVQLQNPFYSTSADSRVALCVLGFMVLALLFSAFYFLYLVYAVQATMRQLLSKRSLLPSLPEARRLFYTGVIYRFSVFIVYTLFCALFTLAFYICTQLEEDSWKWGSSRIEFGSAFITGTYGMWNMYVFSLLFLYAPSHKGGRPGACTDHTQELLVPHGSVGDVSVGTVGLDSNVRVAYKPSLRDSVERSVSDDSRTMAVAFLGKTNLD